MMSYSPCLHRKSHQFLLILTQEQPNACRSHRCPAPSTLQLRKRNFVPVLSIIVNNGQGFHASLAWCSPCHALRAKFVLLCYPNRDGRDGFLRLGLSECLGCGDMHDRIITILPIHPYLQSQWSLTLSDVHHLLVDKDRTGVKLPRTVLVPHGIAHRCQHHRCLEPLLQVAALFHIIITMFENLQGKSPQQKFWLKLMNTKIQKKFLKMKEMQQTTCLGASTFEDYYTCVGQSKQQMELYMLSMQFYQRKFEKCIEEGVQQARYKETNVYNICSRKMTEHMKKMKL